MIPTDFERSSDRGSVKGLRQFLDPRQQREWLEGEANQPDTDERSESLEQRFKYAARFEKLLRRSQAREVLEIRQFLAHPHALRAIRRFNLTRMNRGRNAYQASHCYSLADSMVD